MSKNSLYETVDDFVKAHPIDREQRRIDFQEFFENVDGIDILEFFEELYSHILD